MLKWLVMGFAGLGLAGYGTYLYTGKPPWQFVPGLPDKLATAGVPKLNDVLPSELSGQDRLYKWRDARGEWHYSSELPGEGMEAEVLTVDRNTNVIPAVGTNAEEKD